MKNKSYTFFDWIYINVFTFIYKIIAYFLIDKFCVFNIISSHLCILPHQQLCLFREHARRQMLQGGCSMIL